MPETPKLVVLADPGYYTLPETRAYDCFIRGGEGVPRIRLRLLNATTLDIPIPKESLMALAHDLNQYLTRS